MAFMEKLKEGTLADAIEKYVSSPARLRIYVWGSPVQLVVSSPCRLAAQSQQQNTSEAAQNWDHPAMAPGHSLRDFLHDPPPTPPSLQRGLLHNHNYCIL